MNEALFFIFTYIRIRTPQTISIYKTYEGKAERSTCVLQLLQNTTIRPFETKKKKKELTLVIAIV